MFALWLFALDSQKLSLTALLFGVLCAAAVFSSYHVLLIITPLCICQIIRFLSRKRYRAIILFLLSTCGIWALIEIIFLLMGKTAWVQIAFKLIVTNRSLAGGTPPYHFMPFYAAYEIENGWYTIIVLLFGVFIALIRNKIWRQWKLVLLVALVLGLLHVFQVLVPVKYDLSRFMFPIAVGAMLLAILVDRYVALAGVVAMALLAGVLRGNDFPVVLRIHVFVSSSTNSGISSPRK